MPRAKLKTYVMPHALPEDKERGTLVEFKAPRTSWRGNRKKNKIANSNVKRTVTLQMCPLPKDYRPSPAVQHQRMAELSRTRRKAARKYRSDGTSPSGLDAHLKSTRGVPGPGQYTPGDPNRAAMPKVLMLPRRPIPGSDCDAEIQTPNSYFPNTELLDKRPTHGPWSKAAVDDSWRCAGEETPGPGFYRHEEDFGGKSFVFGRHSVQDEKERKLRRAQRGPGPGQYPNWKGNRPASARTVIKPSDCRRYERHVQLQREAEPGPGSYTPDRRQPTDVNGGKFSKARPISDTEKALKNRLYSTPGPGQYTPDPDFNHRITHTDKLMQPANVPSTMDHILKHAAEVPGPGEYHFQTGISPDLMPGERWVAPRPSTAPSKLEDEGTPPSTRLMVVQTKVHGGPFARASRTGIAPDESESAKIPGPGAYNLPGAINGQSPGGQIPWLGRTLVLHDAAEQLKRSGDVGPGDYNVIEGGVTANDNPWGTWRSATRHSHRKVPDPPLPGPGQYTHLRDSTADQWGGSFGKETRDGVDETRRLEEAGQVPGPGSYYLAPTTGQLEGGRLYVYNQLDAFETESDSSEDGFA